MEPYHLSPDLQLFLAICYQSAILLNDLCLTDSAVYALQPNNILVLHSCIIDSCIKINTIVSLKKSNFYFKNGETVLVSRKCHTQDTLGSNHGRNTPVTGIFRWVQQGWKIICTWLNDRALSVC